LGGLYSAQDVRELFRVIAWMMELPPGLDRVFRQELDRIQEEKQMPYITSIERLARCEGMCMGIESMLKWRFGAEGLKLMPEINELYEGEKLEAILKALETVATPDELRRIWSPSAP